jgi:hypothetical protein
MLSLVFFLGFLSLNQTANAEDLELEGFLETGYYRSDATITTKKGCRVSSGRQVWLLAGNQIRMMAGFRVESGAVLSAVIGGYEAVPRTLNLDKDGLPDWWELNHFDDLAQGDTNDFDADGFSNFTEYNLGSNPVIFENRPSGLSYRYDALGRLVEITRIPRK